MLKKVRDLKTGDVITVSGNKQEVRKVVTAMSGKCIIDFMNSSMPPVKGQDPEKEVEVLSSW